MLHGHIETCILHRVCPNRSLNRGVARSRKRAQARFRIRKLVRILGQRRGIKCVLRAVSTNRLTGFERIERISREYRSSSSREICACLGVWGCVSCAHTACISARSRSRWFRSQHSVATQLTPGNDLCNSALVLV